MTSIRNDNDDVVIGWSFFSSERKDDVDTQLVVQVRFHSFLVLVLIVWICLLVQLLHQSEYVLLRVIECWIRSLYLTISLKFTFLFRKKHIKIDIMEEEKHCNLSRLLLLSPSKMKVWNQLRKKRNSLRTCYNNRSRQKHRFRYDFNWCQISCSFLYWLFLPILFLICTKD